MLYTNDMDIQENVLLSQYSTMRLGGTARALVDVSSPDQLVEAISWAEGKTMPVIVIGEGTNIIWRDEGFNGLVIVNKIRGFEKLSEDDDSATYKIGAGEDWDSVVGRLVGLGLSGVEGLSLIPGTAGATPVQNVGAYGAEISRVFISLDAYDSLERKAITIEKKDCEFGYRTSRFKTIDKGRFFITSITLKLSKSVPTPPFYAVLQEYLTKNNIHEYSVQTIRDAVIAIRKDKMPDWHVTANNGSFFANPIVTHAKFESLKENFPGIVGWDYDGSFKLSAGWLLETAGLKGIHDTETGMATSDKTALVLINEHAKSTADLLKFKQKIVDSIQEKFGVELEQEPELLP